MQLCVHQPSFHGRIEKKTRWKVRYIYFLQITVNRGTEKEEVINLRMTNAVVELEMSKNFGIYDKFLVNDTLEETFTKLIEYVNEKYGLNLKV